MSFSRPACAAAYACVWSWSSPLDLLSAMIADMKPTISAEISIITMMTVMSAMPRSAVPHDSARPTRAGRRPA